MKGSANGFSADVTRRVVGVTYRQLVYWDKTGLIRPTIQKARGRGSRRVYSFEDLVELRVVARLLAVNISLRAVRKVARYLRQHFTEVVRPLAQLSLLADGKSVLVQTTDRKHLIDATAEGQLVITVAVAPIVQDLKDRVAELRATRNLTVRVAGREYTAVLSPDLEAGGYSIEVPELPGVVTEADTISEARKMVSDAVRLWLDTSESVEKRRAAR
ncbi:MAG TPA: MerR family transcriptional regulator [Polyangiaceae bacterium]|nr:MerR family transcriptional regulator [Polyangiaceae bacterium]